MSEVDRSEWRLFFCVLPRRVDGRLVWLRSVWRRGWYFGCIAGAWSGWDYRLTVPIAGVSACASDPSPSQSLMKGPK